MGQTFADTVTEEYVAVDFRTLKKHPSDTDIQIPRAQVEIEHRFHLPALVLKELSTECKTG